MTALPVLKPQKCKRCGHEWYARVPRPVVCSKCKRADWNITRTPRKEAK